MLEELQQRFDFSEVETEGLEIKKVYETDEPDQFDIYSFQGAHLDLSVVIGEINNSIWLGIFDRESGKLKYQYIDVEHPISYSAYGIEYTYDIGDVVGMYYEENGIAIAIIYPEEESSNSRLDLISFDEDGKTYRTTIVEHVSSLKLLYATNFPLLTINKWSENAIIFYYEQFNVHSNFIIYDIYKQELLCNIQNFYINYSPIDLSFRNSANTVKSPLNPLHFWRFRSNKELNIEEYSCSYDTFIMTNESIRLFDPYTGDSSKEPLYSVEYKTQTDDHISIVVTQTEYDGTTTTKTVDARVENDELKVEIE
ncbi:MAG: hypothetical protein NC548_18515 [Lachnospiraceae bacterium]|nr:hypothetical protein [Lachnospiraceae bacterium]